MKVAAFTTNPITGITYYHGILERDHDYFWKYIISKYPEAVEEHYYDGIELDFWPSQNAKDTDDGNWKNCYSCHHDENGYLKIYTGF